MLRLVGDIHGKFKRYAAVVEGAERSIQVGDFGLGFSRMWDEMANRWLSERPQHQFIRGNHDDPRACAATSGWIRDGSFIQHGERKIMLIGGAWSIDRARRTEGIDWWPDEELGYGELDELIRIYELEKPDVMITHDCPSEAALMFTRPENRYKTRTAEALQAMFDLRCPELWCFGHWHQTASQVIRGTRFLCLGELQAVDLGEDMSLSNWNPRRSLWDEQVDWQGLA